MMENNKEENRYKKRKPWVLLVLLMITDVLFLADPTSSQISINVDGSLPNGKSMLDVKSSNKGVLIPRMTSAQMSAINSPNTGLLVFLTDGTPGFYYYNGSSWTTFFTTVSSGMIDYDGNSYRTIKIGNKEMMGENLRVTHYLNGDAIPNVLDNSSWAALTSGAYCWYNNDQGNGNLYGNLYNWYAVYDSRKLCPVGWHVPTDAEFLAFTNSIGGSAAGGKMKYIAVWSSPNLGATDISTFRALPGGSRGSNGTFYDVLRDTYFWTSSESSPTMAWCRNLNYNSSSLVRVNYHLKYYGFSVRCMRD